VGRAIVSLRDDESTLFATPRALLKLGWVRKMEKVPAASLVEVVQVTVTEPPETTFPETEVIWRADAKGAASARMAQSLNMASIF